MLNWDLVDNVFLDMDGTLLDLHFDNYFWLEHLPQRYAETRGECAEDVRNFLVEEYGKMRGQLNWYCLEYWQAELDLDIVALKRELIEKIRFRPSAELFLETVRAKGKHIALVSNAHRWSISLKTEVILSESAFDAIHSSHDFGFPKEDQAFWEGLNRVAEFDPKRTLFIDDNEQVLESANQYGIAHLFSIHQPDLQKGSQSPGKFPQIKDFKDLI